MKFDKHRHFTLLLCVRVKFMLLGLVGVMPAMTNTHRTLLCAHAAYFFL